MRECLPVTMGSEPAPPAGDERKRRDSRVPFHAVVSLAFADGGTFSNCEIRDLSLRSIFIEGVDGRGVGETCRLELCLTGTSSRTCLSIEGTVVRRQEAGIAVRFTSMDPDSFFHLQNIIYYNSEDADTLQDPPFRGAEED
jgi:hypothetical protein